MKRVYFIKPIGMVGPVKIGCSQSPTGRREALETWAPFALEIVAEIEGGFEIERRFHSMFANSYLRREWFNWTPEMGNVILAVAAGTFDLSTLPEAKPIPRSYLNGKTGPTKGTKWSDARKAMQKVYLAERRIEKATGLIRDYSGTVSREDFMADPFKHGVTREEAVRRRDERHAAWLRRKYPSSTSPADRQDAAA